MSKSIFGGGESEIVLQMESSKYFPVLTALPPLPSELAMRVLLPSPLTLLRIRGSSSKICSRNLEQNLIHLVSCYEHLYTIYLPIKGAYRVTHLLGKSLPLTWFRQFWQLVGRYCSYLLPRQDDGTYQILEALPFWWVTL